MPVKANAGGAAGLKQRLICTFSPQQRHLHLRFSGARMETSMSLLPLAVGLNDTRREINCFLIKKNKNKKQKTKNKKLKLVLQQR